MPDTPKKFYLTTPIYYVNARPHIGHAYSTIAADVIARRHRLLGDDTFFLTGTDEHGQKVQRSAEKAGIPPQQFADEVSATFQNLWKRMGITNDDYIRTTEERHKRGVQKLWKLLEERGAIYLSSYTGEYCVSEEMFVEGPPGTIGPDGKPTETVTEENYFFRLSDYQQKLIDRIESDTLHIQPEAIRNEVLSFIRGGLKDVSISRTSVSWGVPVPDNEKHTVYVWFDALINYITAVGYGSDDPADIARFEKYWPADLHLVGKEITRFHCVYWPAFLMAADLPLPKSVVANGWLLFEESKMSKSRGNVVRTETILDAFGPLCPPVSFTSPALGSSSGFQPAVSPALGISSGLQPAVSTHGVEGALAPGLVAPTKTQQDLFASDVIRYFLLREIPFGQDGSFSFDALITRYNADLANGYGNLVSRVLNMVEQYFGGHLPSVQTTVAIDRLIFPEWWKSDPYTTEANFDEERLLKAHTGAPITTAFMSIRDQNKKVGMALFSDLSVAGGEFFYSRGSLLTVREFLQVAVDPLLRAAQKMGMTFEPSRFLQALAAHVRIIDEFLSISKPWKLTIGDPRRSEILNASYEYIRIITALLYPVMPYATASVWAQMGLGSIEEAAHSGELKDLKWGGLKPGTKLGPLAPIFPRADKGLAQIMTEMESPITPAAVNEKLVSSVTAEVSLLTGDPAAPTAEALNAVNPTLATPTDNSQPATPNSPQITIDDFIKIDLRVAQIVIAERIPKADKLLRLEVDLGPNFTPSRRQILSGIAEWYTPEELIGMRIAVIANLAPRKMRGLESHGMLLAASGVDHTSKPILATFSDEIALGSRIK